MCALGFGHHETYLVENGQVLRDCRLGNAKLSRERIHRARLLAKPSNDLQAHRMRQSRKDFTDGREVALRSAPGIRADTSGLAILHREHSIICKILNISGKIIPNSIMSSAFLRQEVEALPTCQLMDVHQWAHTMVRRYGRQSIAYQTLLPGVVLRAYPRLPALVGYVERWHARVVVGLPITPLESLQESMAIFEREAAEAGRSVCYFGVEEGDAACLGRRGRMRIGAQPIWIPGRWAQTLKQHPSIHAQIRRARNKGVEVHEWPLGCVSESRALRACLRDWISHHRLPPMHFLAEPDILAHLYDRRVFVAEREGVPVAFLIATPIPKRKGWLVEQLIRGSSAPNGTSELLLDALMGAVRGAEMVSLGLTPLTLQGKEEGVEALWLRLVVRWARMHGRRFYNFHGIEAFRARLAPDRWENVYAVVNAPQFTQKDLFAIIAAFTQEPVSIYLMRALFRAAQWEWRRGQEVVARLSSLLSILRNRGKGC